MPSLWGLRCGRRGRVRAIDELCAAAWGWRPQSIVAAPIKSPIVHCTVRVGAGPGRDHGGERSGQQQDGARRPHEGERRAARERGPAEDRARHQQSDGEVDENRMRGVDVGR